jgi:hypothetical protein
MRSMNSSWYCSEPRLSFNKVVGTRFRIALENRRLAAGTIKGDWPPCDGWPTRRQMPVCLALNSPPESVA